MESTQSVLFLFINLLAAGCSKQEDQSVVHQFTTHPLEIATIPETPVRNSNVTFIIKGIKKLPWSTKLEKVPDYNFRWEFLYPNRQYRLIFYGRTMTRNTSEPFVEGVYRLSIWSESGIIVRTQNFRLRVQDRLSATVALNSGQYEQLITSKSASRTSIPELMKFIKKTKHFNVNCYFKGHPHYHTTSVLVPVGAKCKSYEFDDGTALLEVSYVNCSHLVSGIYGCEGRNDLDKVKHVCNIDIKSHSSAVCKTSNAATKNTKTQRVSSAKTVIVRKPISSAQHLHINISIVLIITCLSTTFAL